LAKKFSGGPTKKRPKFSKKITKNSTFKPLPGGATEKRTEKQQKKRKIALLSSVYYIYTMYENLGGPRPP